MELILGITRHFKVPFNPKRSSYSGKEFELLMAEYDISSVIENNVDLYNIKWDVCYCSSLKRAVTTAKAIYSGTILVTELLVEVPLSSFTKFNLKLPLSIWHIGARIAWFFSLKSQKESIGATNKRINKILQIILESGHQKILIVSHGFFMKVLERRLRKLKFKGKISSFPLNGKLYLFNKNV